jgi:hypothetical protein
MTKQEAFRLLVLIETVYPYCIAKEESVINWFRHCSEMDYHYVWERLMEHIRKFPYPPSMNKLVEGNKHEEDTWIYEYAPRK